MGASMVKMEYPSGGENPKLQYKNGTGTIVNKNLTISNIGFKPFGIILRGTYTSSGTNNIVRTAYMLIDGNVICKAESNNTDVVSYITVTFGDNDLTIHEEFTSANISCEYTVIGM